MAGDLAEILLRQTLAANPRRYAAVLEASESETVEGLRTSLPNLRQQAETLKASKISVERISNAVYGTGYARKRKGLRDQVFGTVGDAFRDREDISILTFSASQTAMMASIGERIYQGAELITSANFVSFAKAKENMEGELSEAEDRIGERRVAAIIDAVNKAEEDAIKSLSLEQQVNAGATSSFMHGVSLLKTAMKESSEYLLVTHRMFEQYYDRLRHRHTEEGVDIQNFYGVPCPVLTDVAIAIWDNLDKSGEIEANTGEELSIYTVNRAKSMIAASRILRRWFGRVNDEIINGLIALKITFGIIAECVDSLEKLLKEHSFESNSIREDFYHKLKECENAIKDMRLEEIPVVKEQNRFLTKTDRFALEHRNNSLKEIALLLLLDAEVEEVSAKVLELKKAETEFLLKENSFFVCQIGTGNPFMGIAPGAIEVKPGEKPVGNLDNVWGSGFNEIRSFIGNVKEVERWAPLYLATSPSFSTDKANVLLVGPPGCGKSLVLKAVGADTDSISVFAVGSDFLTCYLGEAQKNPKRLFEAALKLRRQSKRDVNILIDEIDEVLNNESKGVSSKINLSLEFQNLMNGVVAYPGIRIWGATNFPERIPVPILRRFSRVEIVGEMTKEDRILALQFYLENFMPVDESVPAKYEDWANALEGATGDIIRKVADEVWRNLIGSLIERNKEIAEAVLAHINEEYGEGFEVSDLTKEDREVIKLMIADGVVVSEFLVESSIRKLLSNFAIKDQIAEACNTYTIARTRNKER